MIEIKLTNGDYIRNMDNEKFSKWVVAIAEDVSLGNIGEKSLECWLNQTPEAVIPLSSPLSSKMWADAYRKIFNRRE